MNIALDYDNTFTLDPESWIAFIKLMQVHNHTVYCVTNRLGSHKEQSEEVRKHLRHIIPIIFAGNFSKREAVDFAKIKIDVWIDDSPWSIGFDNIPILKNI